MSATVQRHLTEMWESLRTVRGWFATVDHKTLGKRYLASVRIPTVFSRCPLWDGHDENYDPRNERILDQGRLTLATTWLDATPLRLHLRGTLRRNAVMGNEDPGAADLEDRRLYKDHEYPLRD